MHPGKMLRSWLKHERRRFARSVFLLCIAIAMTYPMLWTLWYLSGFVA